MNIREYDFRKVTDRIWPKEAYLTYLGGLNNPRSSENFTRMFWKRRLFDIFIIFSTKMEEETAKKTTLTENKSETAEKEPKSTNAEADEKNSRPKISLLKLKSMNGINTAMEGVSANWNIS